MDLPDVALGGREVQTGVNIFSRVVNILRGLPVDPDLRILGKEIAVPDMDLQIDGVGNALRKNVGLRERLAADGAPPVDLGDLVTVIGEVEDHVGMRAGHGDIDGDADAADLLRGRNGREGAGDDVSAGPVGGGRGCLAVDIEDRAVGEIKAFLGAHLQRDGVLHADGKAFGVAHLMRRGGPALHGGRAVGARHVDGIARQAAGHRGKHDQARGPQLGLVVGQCAEGQKGHCKDENQKQGQYAPFHRDTS